MVGRGGLAAGVIKGGSSNSSNFSNLSLEQNSLESDSSSKLTSIIKLYISS